MKNIFLLTTNKPSTLGYHNDYKLHLHTDVVSKNLPNFNPQNIYIISDEEIKKENWIFDLDLKKVVKANNFKVIISKKSECWYYKKIILTTDQDLIKDGVQAIDDEFLEWFVKNPSCKEVEINTKTTDEIEIELKIHGHDIGLTDTELDEWLKNGGRLHSISIPKEKPKKSFQEISKNCGKGVQYCGLHSQQCQCDKIWRNQYLKQEPKQETLEEAAEKYYKEYDNLPVIPFNAFIADAKMQAKRMYSEEEVRELVTDYEHAKFTSSVPLKFTKWFEQFRKKR